MIADLAFLVLILFEIAVGLFILIAGWRLFAKAGKPGWGIFIPIYNAYLWVKIAGRPGWWVVLFFVPIVNIVIAIMVAMDVAKAFGKSGAFGFFLLFLFSFIGVPVIGYGSARYSTAVGTPA